MRPRFLDSPHSYTRTPRMANRHAQGWRDQQPDQMEAARGILHSLALALIAWGILILAIFGAVSLIG